MALTQFSGLASGIDSASIIDAVIQARETSNEIRRSQISFLNSENEALEEFNTKLLALEELIDKFRTVNGGGITKKTSSSDSTVATATAGSGAAEATYGVTVTSVAKNATGSSTHSYSAGSDAVSAGSGNITLSVGTGAEKVDLVVPVTGGSTTVDELVTAINNHVDNDGLVYASTVNLGSTSAPDYRIFFTTRHSGTEKGELAIAADAPITEFAPANVATDAAANAVFTLPGLVDSITRASNSVTDVISGLTLQLYKSGSANITVSTDADGTADALNEIMDAFNELVEFVNENDLVERVEDETNATNVYSPLAKTRVDDDFMASFRNALLDSAASSGTSVTSISELGVSTNRDGTVSVDMDKLKEAIADDPVGAGELLSDFADTVSGVNGTIYQYTKLAGFIDTAIEGNNDEINSLNEAIKALERRTDKLRDSMTQTFARLESTMGELQSKQSELTSALQGLG